MFFWVSFDYNFFVDLDAAHLPKNGEPYGETNCLYNIIQSNAASKCGCIPMGMKMKNDTSSSSPTKICNIKGSYCFDSIISEGLRTTKCPKRCKTIKYYGEIIDSAPIKPHPIGKLFSARWRQRISNVSSTIW